MDLFSQRKGFESKKEIQINSMDMQLREGLWTALTLYYWNTVEGASCIDNSYPKMRHLVKQLWIFYFKRRLEDLDYYWYTIHKFTIKKHFFSSPWYKVYDFIEFVVNNYPSNSVNKKFMEFCNVVLKNESSAYRFVEKKIRQITSEEELAEIEDALAATKSIKPVNIHLKCAFNLLTDRTSPDYRNSVKEAISAVESICKLITVNPKVTMGQALKVIKDKLGLHPALINAFSNLYGYTSAADGIRHGLMDETNLDYEDAKFMVVTCSAFINYLILKLSKVGIKL